MDSQGSYQSHSFFLFCKLAGTDNDHRGNGGEGYPRGRCRLTRNWCFSLHHFTLFQFLQDGLYLRLGFVIRISDMVWFIIIRIV